MITPIPETNTMGVASENSTEHPEEDYYPESQLDIGIEKVNRFYFSRSKVLRICSSHKVIKFIVLRYFGRMFKHLLMKLYSK